MFYELDSNGVFVCDAHSTNGLQDWTAVELPQPCHAPYMDGVRSETGEWVGVWKDAGPGPEELTAVERLWRDSELTRADIELNKVQDGMGVGTVTAWRTYRVALRAWPEHDNFPAESYRPSAPDAQ